MQIADILMFVEKVFEIAPVSKLELFNLSMLCQNLARRSLLICWKLLTGEILWT